MVTVIIPSYNHADFIKRRIDSVLYQTYRDFEIIILEDCSKDNSLEIVELYKSHPKVTAIISNEANSGSVFKQWKKGIVLAKGDYIWIAESDDFTDENFLKKIVNILDKDKSLGFVYSNSWIVDENEKISEEYATYTDKRNASIGNNNWNDSFKCEGNLFLEKYLSFHCYVNNASAVVFRSEFLKNLSFDINEYRFAGDWAVYMDIAMKANVYYLHENLSYYRDHANNASKKASVNDIILIEFFKNVSRYYNWLKENNKNTKFYIDKISIQIIPSFIVSKNKLKLYKELKIINNSMLKTIAVKFIPSLFIYTYNKLRF